MKSLFLFFSVLLPLISPVVYSRAILRGKAKPHRTTRFVLLLNTSIATLSLLASHNHVAVWLALVSAIQALVIFSLSLRKGMGGWSMTDLVCLGIALLGIVLWQTTTNPMLALYASIASDLTGMVPAIIKTYHHPETEIWSFFALDSVAGLFNLLALSSYTLKDFSYPLYIVLINAFMVILIKRFWRFSREF
jgi:hypothetical protein